MGHLFHQYVILSSLVGHCNFAPLLSFFPKKLSQLDGFARTAKDRLFRVLKDLQCWYVFHISCNIPRCKRQADVLFLTMREREEINWDPLPGFANIWQCRCAGLTHFWPQVLIVSISLILNFCSWFWTSESSLLRRLFRPLHLCVRGSFFDMWPSPWS